MAPIRRPQIPSGGAVHPHDLAHPTTPTLPAPTASVQHSTMAPAAVQHTLHSLVPEPLAAPPVPAPSTAPQTVQLWQMQQDGSWRVVGGPMQLPAGVPIGQQIVYGGAYSEFRPV